MSAHKCKGRVYQGLGYGFRPCGNNAAHEHEGHWFCKTHHPPTIKAKSDARTAGWNAKWDAQNVANKAESAANAEQKRRADCYPDLLAALEYAMEFLQDWEDLTGETYARKARSAIAKANGAKP
jgi:hypothetical protein